jgi:hypothetical protein
LVFFTFYEWPEAAGPPGAIDEDIYVAEFGNHFLDHGVYFRAFGNIYSKGHGFPPGLLNFRGSLFGAIKVHIHADHITAFLRQHHGDAPPEAYLAARPGDNGDFVL